MAYRRSLDFLPGVFRTDINNRILTATVDQLISEPELKRLDGYIGRKFAPSYKATDSYIEETLSSRQDYQLEPATVYKDDMDKVQFVSTYQDLIDRIKALGGITEDHSRLFRAKQYIYDGLFDYDKFMNFSSYYWLPSGPFPVPLAAPRLENYVAITVTPPRNFRTIDGEFEGDTFDTTPFAVSLNPRIRLREDGYTFSNTTGFNPTLRLSRGGTYDFSVDQQGHGFFIQTQAGLNLNENFQKNLFVRDVYGVVNNGAEFGTITFNVPSKDAQDFFINMTDANPVNLVAYSTKKNRRLRYIEVQYRNYQDFLLEHNGIDGGRFIDGKEVVFLPDQAANEATKDWAAYTYYEANELIRYGNLTYRVESSFTTGRVFSISNLSLYDPFNDWYDPAPYDSDDIGFDMSNYDRGDDLPETLRDGSFKISIGSDGLIKLIPSAVIAYSTRVNVLEGTAFGNRQIYLSDQGLDLIPNITANRDVLYYQDSTDPGAYGIIELVEQETEQPKIDVVTSIIGKKSYTSPNGVIFTNGLKVRFDENVEPASYANKEYYVEGVGSAIRLVDVDKLVTPETYLDVRYVAFDVVPYDTSRLDEAATFPTPTAKEYTTINRASQDGNAWSRLNRWFHEDVLKATAEYTGTVADLQYELRAKRPIIEFQPDLQLYNFGKNALPPVTLIDTTTTDALSQVEGKGVTLADNANTGYISDGTLLQPNMTVIFAADPDPDVRSKIWQVSYIRPQSSTEDRTVSFQGDGVTNEFDLGFTVTDVTRLSVLIDGIRAVDAGYNWSLTDSNTITFDNNPPFTAPLSGRNITVYLIYDLQIHLEPLDITVKADDSVIITEGLVNKGYHYRYDGSNWLLSQNKLNSNQVPLFALVDKDYVNLNSTAYDSTTFAGTKIFGYKQAETGRIDPELGIRLSYRNLNNVGDIVFSDFITSSNFDYKLDNRIVTTSTKGCMLIKNMPDGGVEYVNQWREKEGNTGQYQTQTYFATIYQRNQFELNVRPQEDSTALLPDNLLIYINNRALNQGLYDIQLEGTRAYLLLDNDLTPGDKLDIKIRSNQYNSSSVYEIAQNLEYNALNSEIPNFTMGQIRNHIISVFESTPGFSGEYVGNNNTRDMGNIKKFGGKIAQNLGATHLANLFLNDAQANFVEGILYAQREYARFKNKMLEAVNSIQLPVVNNPVSMLDAVIYELTKNKSELFPYFTSDMLPYGEDYTKLTYVIQDPDVINFDVSRIYDYTQPNNKALSVYHNGRLLIKNREYVLLAGQPVVQLVLDDTNDYNNQSTLTVQLGDVIEIREYNNTDGSHIPPTPTKLGLYPVYMPRIITDGHDGSPRPVLRGHDGSYTSLFGDARDDVLLEFELRIYNNLKVNYDGSLSDIRNYIPGAFRTTEYNKSEFERIISPYFNSWLGKSGLAVNDFNGFESNDEWSWNYSNTTNKFDGKRMPAAYWRGIYKHYLDTDAPHLRPWEMLGFSEEPAWWTYYYGPAPYTRGNKVLWDDLEAGRIVDGERKGIDKRYARPKLTSYIPVNESGETLSPFQCFVANYDSLDFDNPLKFGDGGPVETAWKQSSEYPFVIQIAIALMHPAEYFGANIDKNRQIARKFGTDNTQWIYSTNGLRSDLDLLFHGELVIGTNEVYRANSYITYITEYATALGLDKTISVGNKIRDLSVQLAYKVSGFTDKKYIKLYADQASPNSINSSVTIPDEDFQLVINKSAPLQRISYSGVIITKSESGYTVNGYDDNSPYFTIEVSSTSGRKNTIKVGNLQSVKYLDSTREVIDVPYGTEFLSVDQVVDFLISYGRYLESQGFVFNERLDEDAGFFFDWDLAAREFMFYVQQGWEQDVAISISPAGSKINFTAALGVVDGLNNSYNSSRVITEDFKILRPDQYSVVRQGRNFSIKTDDGSGIYLLDIDVVVYEHVMVLNNLTRFSDVIFEPTIGARQFRIKVAGYKTGDWDGSFGAAGFIINDDNIQEWQPGKNYYKGEIVRLKNAYYTASVNIPGSSEFDNKIWLKSDYNKVKKGLLPNLANRAGASKQFYDIDAVNLELDADRLGKGLIGLRPRTYFEDLQISDTSQVKFYQGMINQKGSKNSIDKLLRAKLDNFDGSITYNEEWALRTGQYGASGSRELLQLALDEKLASRDPLIIELLDAGDTKTDGRLGYYKNDIYEKAQPYNKNYLGIREYVKLPTDLPTAGYPLLDDVDWTSISLGSLNNNVRATQALPGDYIWVARDETNDWSMLRITETGVELEKISINRNGLATITMKANHNLSVGDYFLIKTVNNSPAISGFFRVKTLRSNTAVEVETRFGLLPETNIKGQYFTLLDFNFENSAEVLERIPPYGYKTGDKLFINNDSEQGWAVYDKQISYTASNLFYAYDPDSLASVPDPTAGGEYGHSIAVNKNETFFLVGQPNNQKVYGYQFVVGTNGLSKDVLIPAPSNNIGEFGKQVAMSNIGIGAISAPADGDNIGYVFIAKPDTQNGSFIVDQALAPYDLEVDGEYGASIAISDDGLWLAVGQPGLNEGVVYVYQLIPVPLPPPFTQQFTGDGSTVDFTLTDLAANPENIGSIFVIVDNTTLEPDVDYTLAGDVVTFVEIPEAGVSIDITVVRARPYEEFPSDGTTEVSSVMLTGDTAGVISPYQVKVTIDNILQIPFRDYQVVDDEVIFTTPTTGSIRIDRKDYFELVTTIVPSDGNSGDRFGASIDFTGDGRRLLVGAPGQNNGEGAVYVFDRMAIEFVGDEETVLFEAQVYDGTDDPDIYLPSTPRVYVDGVLQTLDSGYGIGEYTVDSGSIIFNTAPAVAARILIETNEIYLTAKLVADEPEEGSEFGSSVKICPTACSVYVGAPYADGPNQKDDVGAVYRFVNQGRFYGIITGTVVNPVVSPGGYLIINDYWIDIPISAGLITVIDLINQAGIPGVEAYSTDDNRLVIESNSLIAGDLLKITADNLLTLEDLGFDIYYQQQKIENPSNSEYGLFGKSIAVMPTADMADIIVIGGERLATKINTVFDAESTTFDRGVTSFSYQPVESGAAFTYQYLGRSDDSLATPGVFIPAETLTSYRIDSFDRFGASIAASKNSIFVGMPGDDTYASNSGAVLQFVANDNPRAWKKIRSQDPKVNINLINRISLVDRQKNQIVVDLDFIDPFKGKISGVAEQEIDYITSYDPAIYTNIGNERRVVSTAVPWSKKQIGQLWWNTSRCRWLEYEQGSIDFRVANWNTAFPGSAVIVFEWVESDVPPSEYVDTTNRNVRVRNVNQFTKYDYYDEQGIERSKYYFWVSGRSSIPSGTGRKLSAVEVENIIANPKSAGISYAALIAPNAIALYNCTQYLKDTDILLSIDYDKEENDNNLHAEYQLIAEGDRTSLPADDIITKMIDSLSGSDKSGRLVPDVTLPIGKKYGKEFRPRQTMFYNRTKALSVAVDYLNRILAKTPVLLDKTTTRLLGDAPLPAQTTYNKVVNDYTELNYLIKATYPLGYRVLVLSDATVQNRWTIYNLVTDDEDISRYWKLSSVQPYFNSRYLERIDWVDASVSSTVTDYVVDFYYNLSRLQASPGQTAKVKDDGRGLYSVLQLNDDNQWIYVRREAATVRIKPDLYDLESNSQGFGNDGFDLQIFDDWPNIETQNILTAIYEDVFTVDLDIEKNNWFFIMMQHLLAEQKYVDWLFKTSFIKVQQIQRVIKQIPVFQKEKQDLVRQYVEETKPYHTKLREFVVGYNGLETALEGMTDFDVPAYYLSQDNRYRSPNGSQVIDNFILNFDEYKPWRDNHKFILSSIEIVNPGSDFIAAPTITIVGGGGSGATAEAFLADGSIVAVVVTNPGSGFTSTPSIIVDGGGGVNAVLAARLDNNKVRKFDTTLKLDRVSSQTSSFLIQFLDATGSPVDIRQEKISRITSEAGVIDILLDQLTPLQLGESISGGWLADTQAEIGYPVQAPVYRIFDDASGRIQVFYRRPEGGLSAAALQELLRESNGGVNELDTSGTTVTIDGSLVDFASANLAWQSNTLYNAGDVILFRGVAYKALLTFTSADVFGNDEVLVEVFDDNTINNDEYSENFNLAAEWGPNTSYESNEYIVHPNGFSLYRVLISFTSGNEFAITPMVKMTGADFNNHIDRLWAYYDPNKGQLGRDVTQLLSGIHYPGVKIQGPNFNQDPGYDVGTYDTVAYDSVLESAEGGNLLDPAVLDTVLTSRFTDIALGTRPEDIITAGGSFIDTYSSHAPEEMIPGRVYDTLDIKVYSTPSDAWENDDNLGMSIVLTSSEVGTRSTFAFTPPLGTADALIVYTANYGRLREGTDFVGDRVNNSITVTKVLLPDDIIYIYALDTGGTGLLFDGDFVTDGVKKSYDIPVDRNLIGQLYVALDGQKVTNYSLNPTQYEVGVSTVFSTVTFNSAPAAGKSLDIYAFNAASNQQAFVEAKSQNFVSTGNVFPDNYIYALDTVVGYDYPLLDKIIVEVNGSRLNPPNQSYYTGDGSTIAFDMPGTIYVDPDDVSDSYLKVYVNGVTKNLFEHWEMGSSDGSTVLQVVFNEAPAAGSEVVVSYTRGAKYEIIGNNNTLLIDSSVPINDGSEISVLTFTSHDKLKIQTQVFQSTTAVSTTVEVGYDDAVFDSGGYDSTSTVINAGTRYTLTRPVNNISYLWVTADVSGSGVGQRLYPGRDFVMINPNEIELRSTLGINPNSFVVVTSFNENTQKPSIGFRIFKDMNDNFEYKRISKNDSTYVTRVVNIQDTEIFVNDVSALADPDVATNTPGAVIIGNELIHYYVKNIATNSISQLRRGVKGTGAIQTISRNTRVYDVSADQTIPNAHTRIWYDQGTNAATNGLGLQYSTTEQAKFLLAKPTLLESRVYDENYIVNGYVTIGYVEGNLYE